MNIKDISTQLLYTTIPIFAQNQNETLSSGTGFIFSIYEAENSSIPLLITNYHVLKDAEKGFFELHIGDNDMPTDKTMRIYFDSSIINSNKLGDLDLIAIPLAATLNNMKDRNIEFFFRSVDQNMIPTDEQYNDFSAIENITFIGYPSALYDEKNKMPIVRQGITATSIWNNFNGEEVFLIDAGVFHGSSGSPVFICNQGAYSTRDGVALGNRLLFVGIISQTMLVNTSTNKSYLNLGKVINSKAMYRELLKFIDKLKNN